MSESSELRRLENEVRSLRDDLRRQRQQADRERQRLLEEQRRALQACRNEMQRNLAEHDRTAQAHYESLRAQYESLLRGDVNAGIAAMDAEYQRLLDDTRRKETQLRQTVDALNRELERVRDNAAQREQGSADEAWSCLQEAVNTLHAVEQKPHEKFMPRRLAVCRGAVKDSNRLYGAGLYEAAAATAISSQTALERLGFSIDDKRQEWEARYELFLLRQEELEALLTRVNEQWRELTHSDSHEAAIDVGYWSRGEYNAAVAVSERAKSLRAEVEQAGLSGYLQKSEGATTEDWERAAEELQSAGRQISEHEALYEQRYQACCERSEWGESIIDFFTDEIDLQWLSDESGYEKADGKTAQSEEFCAYALLRLTDEPVGTDIRGVLILRFVNASGDRITVGLLPEEKDGTVRNRVTLHIEFTGASRQDYSRDLLMHLRQSIGQEDGAEDFVTFAEQNETGSGAVNFIGQKR